MMIVTTSAVRQHTSISDFEFSESWVLFLFGDDLNRISKSKCDERQHALYFFVGVGFMLGLAVSVLTGLSAVLDTL